MSGSNWVAWANGRADTQTGLGGPAGRPLAGVLDRFLIVVTGAKGDRQPTFVLRRRALGGKLAEILLPFDRNAHYG